MNYRQKTNDLIARQRLAQATKAREQRALFVAEQEQDALEMAQRVLQEIAETIQQQASRRIASVVTSCLEAVFDDPYQFVIDFRQLRGKTEAELLFERNGLKVSPLTASGGGVVDLAAFALRLACLALARPQRRRVLVLDEPLKFLSKEYRPAARQIIAKLSEEFKCQFICVTHIAELQIGKVIEL